MAKYLVLVRCLLGQFTNITIEHIPRVKNSHADSLAKLVLAYDTDVSRSVSVELLPTSSIARAEEVAEVTLAHNWMTPLIAYLTDDTLPEDRSATRHIQRRAPHYIIHEQRLYKRRYSMPLLRCLAPDEAHSAVHEMHEGAHGNHSGSRTLAHRLLR